MTAIASEEGPMKTSPARDYQRGGRSDQPAFLADHLPTDAQRFVKGGRRSELKRQARHMAG
jgi:hypothetical protein